VLLGVSESVSNVELKVKIRDAETKVNIRDVQSRVGQVAQLV
jgi:hypothetical protein